MPSPATIRRLLSVACSASFVVELLSGCGSSVVDHGAPAVETSVAGAGGGACPLPATAALPPVCVACIHAACPAVYADLCAANCGADELGAPCLSAQREIGSCVKSNCRFECAQTHGSVVPPDRLPSAGSAGNGGSFGSGGNFGSGGPDIGNDSAGAGDGIEIAEGGAAGAPGTGDAGSAGAVGECSLALPLECGDRLNHSTLIQGRRNLWSGYGSTQRAESGRETIYALSTAADCVVIASLKNLETDLDLLLVPACDSSSSAVASVKASSTPLDLQTEETFSWMNPADQVSYLVVDGYAGAEGSYTLEVDCSCSP
jgi:hypothetical protein